MKVIGYVRVSTTQQDVVRQTAKIKEWCITNNHQLLYIIEDFGISGALSDRKGYRQLLGLTYQDCDCVVVSELSRLSRQEYVTETVYNIQNIINNGINVTLLDNATKIYEANKPLKIEELLILTIQAYGAAQERLEIKRKNQDGKVALFNTNPYAVVDSFIPYGFRKVQNTQSNRPKYILDEVPEEVANIKKIFELVLSGSTLYGCAQYFNERNITFRKGYASVSSMSKLLHNDLYRGIRRRKQSLNNEPPIIHEVRIKPIIPEEDFLRAAKLITQNHKTVSYGKVNYNPLKGIIRCRCGRAMTVKDKRPKEGVHKLTYRCSNCNDKNHPLWCGYGNDEVSYSFTNRVISSLFRQRAVEIKEYFDNSTDERIQAINEVVDGLARKKNTLNLQKEQLDNELKATVTKFLVANGEALLKALNAKVEELESNLKEVDEEITALTQAIINQKQKIADIEKVNKFNVWAKIKIISLEELSSVFNATLERIEYHRINVMKGVFVVNFLSGQKSVILVSKVRNYNRAYLLPDDWTIDLTEGVINAEWIHSGTDQTGAFNEVVREVISFSDFFKSYLVESSAHGVYDLLDESIWYHFQK